MIDLSLLQPVSWVAAAIGVCVAAVYYALNLRETIRNRRAALTTTLLQPSMTREGAKLYTDLISMDWKDFEDFQRKYDSRVNPNNWYDRAAFWNWCELIGYQYRTGQRARIGQLFEKK